MVEEGEGKQAGPPSLPTTSSTHPRVHCDSTLHTHTLCRRSGQYLHLISYCAAPRAKHTHVHSIPSILAGRNFAPGGGL